MITRLKLDRIAGCYLGQQDKELIYVQTEAMMRIATEASVPYLFVNTNTVVGTRNFEENIVWLHTGWRTYHLLYYCPSTSIPMHC